MEWNGTATKRDVVGGGGFMNVCQKKKAGKANKSL